MANTQELKRSVPLHKVVRASIMDTYEDLGRVEQSYSHWAARGLQKLIRESLRTGKQSVLLLVNKNTNTATLPPDFDGLVFIGYINEFGKRVPIQTDENLVDAQSILVQAEELCGSCRQNKAVCQDLRKTEEVNLVRINGAVYEERVLKTLYPNGDYYLEKQTPYFDTDLGIVKVKGSRQFITALSLKDCGCLENTKENIGKLQQYCPEVYSQYYTTCCNERPTIRCKIFHESGVIVFSDGFPFDRIYMEYTGFMPKINGQYQVPAVAFETLVEFVKFKAIQNKKGVTNQDKDRQFQHYQRERENMKKITSRFPLSYIINLIGSTPRLRLNSTQTNCGVYQGGVQPCAVQPQQQAAQPNIVHTYERETVGQMKAGKLEFTVDDAGAPLPSGEYVLIINERNVDADSVRIVLDGNEMYEGLTDQKSYTLEVGLDSIHITFTEAAELEQKYKITWFKTVTV